MSEPSPGKWARFYTPTFVHEFVSQVAFHFGWSIPDAYNHILTRYAMQTDPDELIDQMENELLAARGEERTEQDGD